MGACVHGGTFIHMQLNEELKAYAVWDAPTRWFHWINAICVFGLIAVGTVILNDNALGIGNPGKVVLKTLHVWIGYAFVANLCWRVVWAFLGNRYARWREMLPCGPGYLQSLRTYVTSFIAGHPEQYVGHNPAGRLGIAALLLLLVIQAATGLLLAGTDLFYPPFGHSIAQWVAASGTDPSALVPYAPDLYDKAAYESMRAMRKPIATLHLWSFYGLLVTVALHIAAVVVTELREGGSIISAMVTGRKILSQKHDERP